MGSDSDPATIGVFFLKIASSANDEKQNDFLSFCRKMQEYEKQLIKDITDNNKTAD